MDIGILTYYNVHNHGAVLQAYALQQVLKNAGYNVKFLRFTRNYDCIDEKKANKYKMSLRSIGIYTKYLVNNGIGAIIYNYKKNRTLNKFRKANFDTSIRYNDYRGQNVCIGSDEVFAIDVGINPFFYGHCLKAKNIFSYAGCFGASDLNSIDINGCKELISSGFNRMNAIGVRDENSYKIASNLVDKKIMYNCDPVILYGYDHEITELRKQKINDRYILLYSYDRNFNTAEEIEVLKKFAKKHNCRIYSVGYYHKWCDKNINVAPIDLLKYFCNAEFIVTDTFHGSVLSIITASEFCVYVRNNSNKVNNLLREYGIENRAIIQISDIESKYEMAIDYTKVQILLADRRKKSYDFLNECLE